MSEKTYRCESCRGEFEYGWSDEEAKAEAKNVYGDLRRDELAIVCDDCYRKLNPAGNPREVEQAVADHIRARSQ